MENGEEKASLRPIQYAVTTAIVLDSSAERHMQDLPRVEKIYTVLLFMHLRLTCVGVRSPKLRIGRIPSPAPSVMLCRILPYPDTSGFFATANWVIQTSWK